MFIATKQMCGPEGDRLALGAARVALGSTGEALTQSDTVAGVESLVTQRPADQGR